MRIVYGLYDLSFYILLSHKLSVAIVIIKQKVNLFNLDVR